MVSATLNVLTPRLISRHTTAQTRLASLIHITICSPNGALVRCWFLAFYRRHIFADVHTLRIQTCSDIGATGSLLPSTSVGIIITRCRKLVFTRKKYGCPELVHATKLLLVIRVIIVQHLLLTYTHTVTLVEPSNHHSFDRS